MHIGAIHLYKRTFPPQIRLEKQARALVNAGHRVTVLARRMSAAEPPRETLARNFSVCRARIDKQPLAGKIFAGISLDHRGCARAIKSFIDEEKPDALHVHDFGPVPTALKIAGRSSIPVIADLHENMPAALRAYRMSLPLPDRLIHAVLNNYHVWRWHQARHLPRCYRVIAVAPEAAETLRALRVPANRIVVVSNTEDATTFDADPEAVDASIFHRFQSRWTACYIGGIGAHRGIDTVFSALPRLRGRIPKFHMVVIGATEDQLPVLRARARRMGIDAMLTIERIQPFEKMPSYILSSRVGLVPHNDLEHTQTTVPHKLFQYMICARPVVVSSCRPLQRIVEDTGAGLVFRAGDPVDLADKLIELYDHPKQSQVMADRGATAVRGKYAWKNDAEALCAVYEDLARQGTR